MTRAQTTLLASLVVAAIAPQVRAQKPADSVVRKDSIAKDTTAPKRGRFGGLMSRARQAADSKAGQAVANVAQNKAVQGAAMGVACNVVPGAAIASVATGTGPCQNSLMGNALTNAAARFSGNSSVGAQAAAIKAMVGTKGGVSGAAAAAAMGALGGTAGVSGMSAITQASAMKMLLGARIGGIPDAAASASAIKMLQSSGMSNVAAAAAIASMMKSSGTAQLSADDAAAALKIIQTMNIGVAAAAASAAATPAATTPGAKTPSRGH